MAREIGILESLDRNRVMIYTTQDWLSNGDAQLVRRQYLVDLMNGKRDR